MSPPQSGWQNLLKLTCWLRGAILSTLGRGKARANQNGDLESKSLKYDMDCAQLVERLHRERLHHRRSQVAPLYSLSLFISLSRCLYLSERSLSLSRSVCLSLSRAQTRACSLSRFSLFLSLFVSLSLSCSRSLSLFRSRSSHLCSWVAPSFADAFRFGWMRPSGNSQTLLAQPHTLYPEPLAPKPYTIKPKLSLLNSQHLDLHKLNCQPPTLIP